MKGTVRGLTWVIFLAALSLSAACLGAGLAALAERLTQTLPTLSAEIFGLQAAANTPGGSLRAVELSTDTPVATGTATPSPTAVPPTPTPPGKTPLPIALATPVRAFGADYEVIADCRGYAFVYDGITVGDGATSTTFLNPLFLDPKWGCAPNEDGVDCMLRLRNPRLVIVALGKNPDPDFARNLQTILAKLRGRSYVLIGRHTVDELADSMVNSLLANRPNFIDYKAEAIGRGLVVYNGSQKIFDAVLHPQWDGFHYSECGFELLRDLVFQTGTPTCTPYVP